MAKAKLRRGLAAAVLLCGAVACLFGRAAPVASAQSSDEAAPRALVDKFYEAFQRRDLDGLMSLWCEQCPERAAARRGFRQTFASNERIEARVLEVRRVDLSGDGARARVSVELSALDAATGAPAKGMGRLEQTFEFRRSGGAWKVWRYAPSEDDLAAALASAEKEEERASLLDGEKELLTPRLVKALLDRGLEIHRQKQPERALATYQIALGLARRLGDRALTSDALNSIGYFYYFQRQNEQAADYYRQSLDIAREAGDKVQMARTLNSMGMMYGTAGDLTKAMESYQRGLALTNEVGDRDAKNVAAYLLDHIGGSLRYRGDTKGALENYGLSLKLAREVGNRDRETRTLNDIGSLYFSQGDYAQALDHFQQELAVAQEDEDEDSVATALNELGNVYNSQGDNRRALEYYEKSAPLAHKLPEQGFYATVLSNIGNIYTAEGNYLKALEYYQQSLKVVEGPNAKWRISIFLNNIGYIHELQGNYGEALSYYEECLKIADELQSKRNRALALNNIGGIRYLQGDYAKALDFHQQSMKLSQETGDKQELSYAFNYIGDVYYAQGDYEKASEFYQKGLALKEELGDKAEISHALYRAGAVFYARGDYAKAAEFAERAAALADTVGNPERLREARTLAGKSYLALKQTERAARSLAEAINATEDLRRQVAGGEQQEERFLENKVAPYYAMMNLLLERGDNPAALAYAERAKGRVLLDVLRGGRLDIAKAMTREERGRERDLNAALVSLNTQLQRERLRERPDEARLADLGARQQKARLEYDSFQAGLYAAHPELRVQRGETPPFSAADALSLMPDAKTALIEFAVTDERTLLFVLTKDDAAAAPRVELKVYPLNVGRKELAAQVEEFRGRLAARDLGFRAPARKLYELLLAPAREQLRGRDVLCIVPDDALWELPFQALQPKDDGYLIEEHAVFYAPSLSVLREMSKKAERQGARAPRAGESRGDSYAATRRAAPAASDARTLLAFGNPALSKETTARVASLRGDESAGPLPEAESEVKALERVYGPARSRVYVGAQAREETVKAQMGDYRVLHFATHGVLDDRNPMYSHLLLSQDANSPAEDGLLEAREIMMLNLRAELAVLSACQTARGRVGAGEGVVGMAWAFFIAGCPTTVVSLWDIESTSTTRLMVEFHRRLRSRDSNGASFAAKASALRAASLKLLGTEQYRHPFYWAGFVMVGDGG